MFANNVEIKATKKFRRINGVLVEDKWKPEPEWVSLYKHISYSGNPMSKKIQKKIHRLYNSLTPELQQDWLKRTSGLGWSDEYIKIALTYWSKQGEYRDLNQERVNEYLMTLTEEEKDNFKDICDVFCPENHKIHIKNSCGFIEYFENKENIRLFMNKIDKDIRKDINKEIKNMSFRDKYYCLLRYTKNNNKIQNFMKDRTPEERDEITDEICDMDWKEEHKYLLDYAIKFESVNDFLDNYKKEKDDILDSVKTMNWTDKFNRLLKYVKYEEQVNEYFDSLEKEAIKLIKEQVEDMGFLEMRKFMLKHKGFAQWKNNN